MDTSRFEGIIAALGTSATRRGVLNAAAGGLVLLGRVRIAPGTSPGSKPKKRKGRKKKACSRLPLGAFCLDHTDCCSGMCARFNVCGTSL